MGQEGRRDRTYDWYYFILDCLASGYDVEEASEVKLWDERVD